MTEAPNPRPVGVVRWSTPRDVPIDDGFGPASPRHATERRTFWQRSVDYGQEALTSSAEAIAVEVDVVADRMMAALEQRHRDRAEIRDRAGADDPAWQVSEVEVTFGVQLTESASIAVFSTEAEASAQITLTFSRSAPPSST
jgi:Trypsin-co-occurring domain 1